jgi:hypothetical protein
MLEKKPNINECKCTYGKIRKIHSTGIGFNVIFYSPNYDNFDETQVIQLTNNGFNV